MEKHTEMIKTLRIYKRNQHFYRIRVERVELKLIQSTIDWEIREYQRELKKWKNKLNENIRDCNRMAGEIAEHYFEMEGAI